MSSAWAAGSTRAWRQVRAYVLARDSYLCKLRLAGCTTVATHAHHTRGRAITGDDPAHIVAACQHCNLKAGDPTRRRSAAQRKTLTPAPLPFTWG